MKKIAQLVSIKIKQKLIRPITKSYTPLNELALGIGIGLFWAFTPLVGIQMYLVFMNWLIFKYVFRIRFDAIVAIALVWISNPLTMFFMYYAFYIVGHYVLLIFGNDASMISFDDFSASLGSIVNDEHTGYLETAYLAFWYLLVELGLPMIVGSTVIGLPIAVAGYFVGKPMIYQKRLLQAKKKNLNYEEWCRRYEKKPSLSLF